MCRSCDFSGKLKSHPLIILFKKKKEREKESTWLEKIKIKGSTWAKGQRAPEAASTCFRNVVDKNTAYRPTYIFTGLGGVREAAWVKATCPPGPEPRQGQAPHRERGGCQRPGRGRPSKPAWPEGHTWQTLKTPAHSLFMCVGLRRSMTNHLKQ